MVAPLEIEEIASLDGLERLRPEWAALWDRVPGATPFQHPAWLVAWWREIAPGRLLTLAVRRAGGLVAVMPLYIQEEAGIRKLLPVGISVTDYLDATVSLDDAEAAVGAAFAHLARRRAEWDIAELHELPAGAALLRGAPPPGLAAAVHPESVVPVLPLPPDRAGLGRPVPRRMCKNANLYRNRAARLGVTHERLPPDRVDEGVDALYALHALRWAARGEAGVVADEAIRRFHRAAAHGLAAAGLLRLRVLHAGGHPIAALYGFAAKGRAYAYLCGLDPEWAEVSPGTQVIAAAIEDAMREGCREFDFLRGEEPFKYLWGPTGRRNVIRTLRPA
jgi:CelD/BcsL family acetyltransferase involved in cellulose biosynthesis